MTWRPDDHELDRIARTLEPAQSERAEHNRTALLARAADQTQLARRPAMPLVLGGAAIAAAAAAIVWLAVRPVAPPPVAAERAIVTPIGAASWQRVTAWPDYVVRVDDGAVAVTVDKLGGGERFRVACNDAEVEVRGTKFDVGVEAGKLASVVVHEGRVEVRHAGDPSVFLSANERWTATRTAEVIVPAPTDTAAAANDAIRAAAERVDSLAAAPKPAVGKPAKPIHATVKATTAAAEPAEPRTAKPDNQVVEPPKPEPAKPAAVSARPGEAEFRAGWAAMRANDAAAAAASFQAACERARGDALDEDACFWAGAAARRAGDTAAARQALGAFLASFPSSPRANEAAALLGWIEYDAGNLDAAEPLFHRAEHDRVPKVRDSAERGLAAIQRKR